ncbi:ABC transporter ATP-binding protein/permease VMR1 [Phytophthora ramorum]|uniref:ABC transporter ATP-binding protein/permease VMR1 n=1 Tax=Phytophthora ramorum TaxID=164328 RepID=UPI00309D94B3|nr:ABC transporter ATP-binding protein/permease VMR1 [Phytophthora ramorum]
MYVKIANFYLAPSREISRLWKVSSSPVLSHVEQSEEGVVVIRAFGRETVDRMVLENFIRNDVNSKCWFAETVTQQWFQVRMQLLGTSIHVCSQRRRRSRKPGAVLVVGRDPNG